MKDYILKYKKQLLVGLALVCAAGVLTGVLLHRGRVRRQEKAQAETERLLWESLQQQLAADRAALAENLQGVWIRTVEEDANTRLELAVRDGEMDYNFRNVRYPEYDQTLLTYGWAVLDGESIELRYPDGGGNLLQVTFTPASGDTPEQVTFSPAITSMDESETWERSAP